MRAPPRASSCIAALLLIGCADAASAGPSAVVRGQRVALDDDGVPRVRFDAARFADRAVIRRLATGLPQVVSVRVAAFAHEGDPIVVVRTCRITYDLWEERYGIERLDSRSMGSLEDVLATCLRLDERVGTAADWAGHDGSAILFSAHVELNRLTARDIARLRAGCRRQLEGPGRRWSDVYCSRFEDLRPGAERTADFEWWAQPSE